MIAAMRMRGFRDPAGSWKMICISLRSVLRAAPEAEKTSTPSKVTVPAVAGMSRRIVLPTVVLPQPDSPTSPSVSPLLMWNEMSLTALTCPAVSWRSPDLTGNQVRSSLTSRSGWVALGVSGMFVMVLDRVVGVGMYTRCRWSGDG